DTLDGFTSINPTAGLPYAPYSTGFMLHEEYQISVASRVSSLYTAAELASMSVDKRTLVESLHRSGMESSRYAELDPGRSCAAAPFIDRCDPKEPYACYRAINMSAKPYGAFLAVNSPRHCSHNEATDGEPLDPLCNECVNRVCQVDPTCCGDPGSGFYPGSLVWDTRCSAIRQQVCKSSADAAAPLWPLGVTAAPAGSHPTVFLHGAVGSFEGITTDSGGNQFAEGWACDPDFPGASIPVQVSVGGELGAAGATLFTATADQPLAPGWKEAVAAECGGAGRQGFRFQLPAASTGKDVFVYGIDLNVPGAPFSLLRGGKKTVPGGPPSSPRAAIWTGWVQPAASDVYRFFASAGSTDRYRVWVNGLYVAGNWVDPDPSVPGAFTLSPPVSPPSLYLQQGVRYGVRVEYLRDPSLPADSRFSLAWSRDGGAPVPLPTGALVPMAQGSGGGLQGTYFPGGHFSGTTSDGSGGSAMPANSSSTAPRTFGALDYLWSDANQPITGSATTVTGASVNDGFAARFQGQVMPPISGDYTFTADTDGSTRIWVNGQLVTSGSTGPPGLEPETCSHDICTTGGAITRTCKQGYFCAARLCLTDPTCCSITWDGQCVQEVQSLCRLDCTPTPPLAISLSAGVKYDITVEYEHLGGAATARVRGAKLRLMWTLAGAGRDLIPIERLFAAGAGAPPAVGVGLNAAYFSDGSFTTEYLDHVEPQLDFAAGTPPTAARATSLICGAPGAPACGPGSNVPGPPALISPPAGASLIGTTVTVKVGGLVRGAAVTFQDNGAALFTAATAASDAADGGELMVNLTLANGSHRLAARQSLGSDTSALTDELAFDVIAAPDPQAPAVPIVNQPPTAGLV
ncbi:MAG TPA: PA14 domain-containing protein, partial [Polyangia bacterium]|nr:PA14 domain-containing protein [Polyangia bacterium]